jgi:hypothetical protein
LVALFLALTALVAVPPPPGEGTARVTGRLVRAIVRQMAHVSNGPAQAIKRLGGEVERPFVIVGGFAARVPGGAVHAVEREPGVFAGTPDSPRHANGGPTTRAGAIS